MRNIVQIILLVVTMNLHAQMLWQMNRDTVIAYYYSDGDEFSGETINKDKWGSWYGWARSIASNKEQQYYTDYKNHLLKNGCLLLTTEKKEVNARLIDGMEDTDSILSGKGIFQGLNKRNFKYQSGLIQSKSKYLRGYFEIKFKAPAERGLWPAFWLYGGSPNEEIDIMELKGERPNQTHVDTHCKGCDVVYNFIGQKKSFGGWIKLNGNLNKGFNVMSALWDEQEVRYYLNGKCIAVSKVKFNQPKHIVANIAVPDNNGPFHPGPDKNTTSFSPLVIDYIRVWTKNQSQAANSITVLDQYASTPPDLTVANQSPKMLYGKKSEHINDGIFISLFNKADGTFRIYCNGLGKNEKYTVKIFLDKEILFEKTTNENELDLPFQQKIGMKIEINYKGRKAEKMLIDR